MAAPVIQFKRGIFSNLPGLRAGEPGFTTDKYDLYVGIDSTTNGNKFFGSHRYWTKETANTGSGVNLVEGTDNGANSIILKAPASIGSDVTYTFPGSAVDQGYLRTNSSGVLTWESGINASGVSTIAYLQATTANVSAAATVGTDLSVNRNLTVSGGITGNLNATGVSTASHLQSTTVNATGIITASSFRGADIRKTDGSLISLVGVNSASGNAGLVTSFKFTGTGLDSFSIINGVANISYTGTASTTYTTSQTIVATAAQTSFTVSAGYQEGFVDVYLNGIRLISGVDYTAQDPNGSVVTLASGATLNDELEFVTFKGLGNIISVQNLKTTGNLTVTGFTTTTNTFRSSGGAVLSGVTTANSVQVTDLNSTGIVTASSFSGSGSGLSNSTVPVPSINITGAGASTSVVASDVFVFQSAATGINGKVSASNLSNYILGGSGGATLPSLFVTGLSTFSGNVTASVGVNGNFNAIGVSTAAFLQATTVNVGSAATIPTLSGTTATFTNITANGGITGAVNNAGVGTVAYLQNTNINSSGIVTASSFSGTTATFTNITANGGITGAVNNAGVGTVAYLQATNVNASGIITASSFSGSGSGLSAGTVPISALDIDGGTAATAVTADDLLIIDDGAGGTNKKVTAQILSNFILGGSGGATFPSINVTGIGTVAFLQATTVNVGSAATIPTLSGTTATFTNITANGGFTGNINATGISTATTLSGTTATFTNITANGGITGNLNASGVSTAAFLQATNVNASGIVTASSFSGSGSGLSNSTVPVPSINITGAGASTSVAASDVFVFQSNATGINGKVTAQNLSNYILGGSGGATFPAINVTGITTATFLKATTATVGAGLTVSGLITGSAGATITGGETTLSSATVSDLTSGRVVIVGTSGSLDDSANLTFGNNGLKIGTGGANVTGISTFSSDLTVSGNLYVNGTTTQINTTQMTVEDSLIELQVVDGAALSSDTNKDVGLIMNYYDTQARKAAFFWDDSATKFVLAATATETTGVISPVTYGALEIGSLYVNDCAGASQVISCSGTTRSLENIVVDGGSF